MERFGERPQPGLWPAPLVRGQAAGIRGRGEQGGSMVEPDDYWLRTIRADRPACFRRQGCDQNKTPARVGTGASKTPLWSNPEELQAICKARISVHFAAV